MLKTACVALLVWVCAEGRVAFAALLPPDAAAAPASAPTGTDAGVVPVAVPIPSAVPGRAGTASEAPSPIVPSTALPGSAYRLHAPIAVAIVVDQLAAWVLRERIDRLAPDGGFARLRREGKLFPEMAFDHAVTETGPGHASLYTGKVPREHGIVANDVINAEGKPEPLLADGDEGAAVVGLEGQPVGRGGVSLEALQGRSSLVASVFRSRYPKGQGIVAALSLKDRGALFGGGETADYALWFDPTLGGEAGGKAPGAFVSSKRYPAVLARGGLVAFLAGYLASGPDDRRGGIVRIEQQPWTGLEPTWLSENAGSPRESAYSGFVQAHVAANAREPGAAFRALPDADRLLFELALRILQTEPSRLPIFLSLSLSANDGIGHLFGPDSWEAWDELRRLDATLAWFFRALDEFGPQAWSVVLTADHGIAPLEDSPKRSSCAANPKPALETAAPCSGAGARGARIHVEDLTSEAEKAVLKAGLRQPGGGPVDKIIAGVSPPYIYLTEPARAALAADPPARARLANRLDGELRRRFKSMHAVVDVAPFKDDAECPDPRADRLRALLCNSISPASDRGGDFYLVLKPGAFVDPDMVKGTGAMHGSPYGYDRMVPLLVRDPSRPELAGQVDETRTPFSQFRDELVRIILSAPSTAR